jgi:peptidoglycan/LPS O-acetylase OafA/YrhL
MFPDIDVNVPGLLVSFVILAVGFWFMSWKNVFFHLLGLVVVLGGWLNLFGSFGMSESTASTTTALIMSLVAGLGAWILLKVFANKKAWDVLAEAWLFLGVTVVSVLYFLGNNPIFPLEFLSLPDNPASDGVQEFIGWMYFVGT